MNNNDATLEKMAKTTAAGVKLVELTIGIGESCYYNADQIALIYPRMGGWLWERITGSWIVTANGDSRFVLEPPHEVARLISEPKGQP